MDETLNPTTRRHSARRMAAIVAGVPVDDCGDVWGAEMKPPKLVVIESPLSGSVRRNVAYAKAALRDSLARGEAPYASHLFYPQVLDDDVPEERLQGIECGLAWGAKAELTAAYVDLGISDGMRMGIERAKSQGRPVEMRTVDGWKWPPEEKSNAK